MELLALVDEVRNHYVVQLEEFVRNESKACKKCSAEVKLQLSDKGHLFGNLYVVDFLKNDDEPEVVEFWPDRELQLSGAVFKHSGISVTLESMRWDRVEIVTPDQNLKKDWFAAWFESWLDPDDRRYQKKAILGNVIHSLGLYEKSIHVDFGSASSDAFFELLDVLKDNEISRITIKVENTAD